VLDQHHQRRLAVTGPGAQVPSCRLAGPAGWAHQDDVDTGEQVPRRLGPPAAGVRHEDHPAQIDTEFGRRHHPGSGRPTAAHQLPACDAAARRAKANVVAP
jgi:hypothetical protein